MSCGKIEIYKKKDWADDFAFVYIRQMFWVNSKWYSDFFDEEAFLIPMDIVSSSDKWSRGSFVKPFTAEAYPGLAESLDGQVGVNGYGAPPLELKPGIKSPYNVSQWAPTVPYTRAELWTWTDQGWCFQASRRNW